MQRLRVEHGIVLATLFFTMAYFSYRNRAFQLEDALIYQRYIQNVLDGHGLLYNPGEVYNGLTSPLYTYLLLAASWAVGDIQSATALLFALFMIGALAAFVALFARYEALPFVLFGALLLTCSRYFYVTLGLETPLFVLLIAICLLLFEKRTDARLGVACALLVLTRGEGVCLVLAMGIEHLRQGRPWPRARAYAIPALLLLGQALFGVLYYGTPLSPTVASKIHQGRSGLWGEWPLFANVAYQFGWFFASRTFLLFGLVSLAAAGVLSLRLRSLNAIVLSFLGLYTGFFVLLNIPYYHWYYAPYYVFGYFYAGVGAGWLLRLFRAAGDVAFRVSGVAAVGVLMALLAYGNLSFTRPVLGNNRVWPHWRPYRDIGLWMKEHVPADAKLAAVEVGTLGWYSELHIIDILGVVTPGNSRLLGDRRFGEWLVHHPPDYILAHDPIWIQEFGIEDAVARGEFVEQEGVAFEGYRLYRRNE